MKSILVTGGCGFIGSNFIRLLGSQGYRIINLDKLTYAGNPENVGDIAGKYYRLVKGDICDRDLLDRLLQEEKPWAVVNFAAESHVDRSIVDASPFLQTNIGGVQALLEAIRKRSVERFLQISTDEVYGDREGREPSIEESPVSPNSPYAATKAAADLLCLAYRRTHGLPIIITRSSNNYGPYQFPEKLIPLLVRNAMNDMELPVYGDGKQVRDWIFVEDNCAAILAVLEKGRIGSIYNIGTSEERTNLEVVEGICAVLAERRGISLQKLKDRVRSVTDRPGHDRRYAINTATVRAEIGWRPQMDFSTGLKRTVDWYLGHAEWVSRVTAGECLSDYASVYAKGRDSVLRTKD